MESSRQRSPILADAADVLSDQLRDHLGRLASVMGPHAQALEVRFEQRLKKMRLDGRVRQALTAITAGSVARILVDGRAGVSFIEHVEYHGRRLAKMNVLPGEVTAALQEYDTLLTPLLRKLVPTEHANFQWVRDQLHFCVILTLNNAYYQVREAETQAFYELFRVELESRNLDELLRRFLATLVQYSRADAAHLYWLSENESWRHQVSVGDGHPEALVARGRGAARSIDQPVCWSWKGALPQARLLDKRWAKRFESCWSVPLLEGTRCVGVMQFAFRRPWEWMPREQELLTAAAERCLMAAEKARLIEDLAQREEQVRTLAEHMMHVEEAERRRISRELHDEAGQSLLCVRLELEQIEQAMGESPLRTRLTDVREHTEKTIIEIRRLIAALSPAVLEQLGLGAALRQLVNRFRQSCPVRVKLQISRLQHLPKRMEIIVYRLIQECCNNIAKHAEATGVMISATSADHVLRLQVEDDGIGFKIEDALEKRNSFGLSGIRERVALLGGRFQIESWPLHSDGARRGEPEPAGANIKKKKLRHGTRIQIELPIPRGTQRP